MDEKNILSIKATFDEHEKQLKRYKKKIAALERENITRKNQLIHVEKYLYEKDIEYQISTLPSPTPIDDQVIEVIEKTQIDLFLEIDIIPLCQEYENRYEKIRKKTIYEFLVGYVKFTVVQNENDICEVDSEIRELILFLCPKREHIRKVLGIHHNTLKRSTDYLVSTDKILQIGSRGGRDPTIRFSTAGHYNSMIAPGKVVLVLAGRMVIEYAYRGDFKSRRFDRANVDIPLDQWFFPRKGKDVQRLEPPH